MTGEIALVLTILAIAIVLFASERIRVDVVSMYSRAHLGQPLTLVIWLLLTIVRPSFWPF